MFGVIPFLPRDIDPTQVLPFIMSGQGEVAAAASSDATIVTTSLLSSYVGVILALGVTVRAVPEYEYTGNLIFRLNINQAAMIDNNQGTWTAQRGSVLTPVPVYINLPLSARVTFVVSRSTTAAALPQTVAFLATGVMWPKGKGCRDDGALFRV